MSGPRGDWFIPKVRDRADTGDGDIAFPGPGNSFFDHQGLLLGGQAKAAKLLGGVPGLLIPTVKGCPWIPAGLVGSPPFYPLFCTIRAGSPRFWGLPGQGRCLGIPVRVPFSLPFTRVHRSAGPRRGVLDPGRAWGSVCVFCRTVRCLTAPETAGGASQPPTSGRRSQDFPCWVCAFVIPQNHA